MRCFVIVIAFLFTSVSISHFRYLQKLEAKIEMMESYVDQSRKELATLTRLNDLQAGHMSLMVETQMRLMHRVVPHVSTNNYCPDCVEYKQHIDKVTSDFESRAGDTGRTETQRVKERVLNAMAMPEREVYDGEDQ